MRIVNVRYSSEIRSWTTGAMTAGAEVMKSTNINNFENHYQNY